jgi:putative Holliday junction resolvase
MYLCRTAAEFRTKLQMSKPLMCIDYGLKRIGIALSDNNRVFAIPYRTIEAAQASTAITQLIQAKGICGVVIGYPLEKSGEAGQSCKSVEAFAKKLMQYPHDIPFLYQDERMSTKMASVLLRETNMKRKERDRLDNAQAACNILQTTLDVLKNV